MRTSGRLATTVLAAVLCGIAAGCTSSVQPSTPGNGTSSGPPTQTASSTPTATQTPSAPLTDFTVCISPAVTCAGEMRTEPATILLSGDSSLFVRGLTWTGWGTATAQGTGTMERDNCNPNCAQGTLSPYQATITLSGLTSYGSGKQAYTTMMITAPSAPNGSYDYQHLLP